MHFSFLSIQQYCFLIVFLITLTLAQQSAENGGLGDDEIVKRATTSHSHNIMRFGRAGHNMMHFGKRGEESATYSSGDDSTEPLDADFYDPIPYLVNRRSLKSRYFIPHAFIASLYTHPRPFLKKADNRDNVFMHFG